MSSTLAANPVTVAAVLCVDDEPHVLEGLSLHLRRRYRVHTAQSGEDGLRVLRDHPDLAVVLSDMRMPGMNGARFLSHARRIAPHCTRVLLTGHADIRSAAACINEGHVFRFLTKPCPPSELLVAVEMAVEQNRLIHAERELLEDTLHGAIEMLTELLSIANPLAFGRANRIKNLLSELGSALNVSDRWQVEVAGMLSQLHTITLPSETVEKLYYARCLGDDERILVTRSAALASRLVGNIPRMELVQEMLARHAGAGNDNRPLLQPAQLELADAGTAMLLVAADFDWLETQGHAADAALDIMEMRKARYSPSLLAALKRIRGGTSGPRELREVPIKGLRIGMIFAEDVKLSTGVLFVPRGHEVTENLVEHMQRLRPGLCKEPLRMLMPERARS